MGKESNGFIFERVEKKYLLSKTQYERFRSLVSPHIEPDAYSDELICSVYYDTPENELIRTSLRKPAFKQKLRLRSYGVPSAGDSVFAEIKKKYGGIVYKRREKMELLQAEAFLDGRFYPDNPSQTVKEINYMLSIYNLLPSYYLSYDREAFVGKEKTDLRVTFDRNITSRTYDLSLSSGSFGDLLIGSDERIMEIKVTDAMPVWLVRSLSNCGIYPVSFSKYGTAYMRNCRAFDA